MSNARPNSSSWGKPGHRPVLVHDLADDGRPESSPPSGPGRRTPPSGPPWPGRRPPWPGEGRCVPAWPDLPAPVFGSMAARMVAARSKADIPVVTPSLASMETVKAVWNRAVFSETISGSWSSSIRSVGQGQADQAPAVLGHEVDDVRGDLLGGDHEVALVLPVLVVDDDDQAARLDLRGWPPRSISLSFSFPWSFACKIIHIFPDDVTFEVDRVARSGGAPDWCFRGSRG